MAITFPRTLPTTPGIKTNGFGLDFNVDAFESPITRILQVNNRPGDRWEGVITLPPMSTSQARQWKAWFATMQGSVKTFYFYDPDHVTPDGIADTGSDSPLVNGASQSGSLLISDGWRLSGTGLLLPGDYFSIGNEFKIVTEQLDSDGGGNATISFKPPLRNSPANNDPITFESPKGVFRCVDNKIPWDSDEFGVTTFSFAVMEALES